VFVDKPSSVKSETSAVKMAVVKMPNAKTSATNIEPDTKRAVTERFLTKMVVAKQFDGG